MSFKKIVTASEINTFDSVSYSNNSDGIFKELITVNSLKNVLEDKIDSLYSIISLLNELNSNPKSLFEKIDLIGNQHSSFFALFNIHRHENNGFSIHDLQDFFSIQANNYFQIWLKENDIHGEYRIDVRQRSTYPSIFAIYEKDKEIIQFNLFEKWYGCRFLVRYSKDKRSSLIKELNSLDKFILDQESLLEELISLHNNPSSNFKTLKSKVNYLFNKNRLDSIHSDVLKEEKQKLSDFRDKKITILGKLNYFPSVSEIEFNEKNLVIFKNFFEQFNFSVVDLESKLY